MKSWPGGEDRAELNMKPNACGTHAGEQRVHERKQLGAKSATAALLRDEGEVALARFCHVPHQSDGKSCSGLDAGPSRGRGVRCRDRDL